MGLETHSILKNPNKHLLMQLKRKHQPMELGYKHNPNYNAISPFTKTVVLLFIALFFTSNSAHSQWLQDLRSSQYNTLTVQYWKAQEINETATSYKSGSPEITQTQITFSVDRRQINQSITRDGVKIESNVFSFSPKKQILSKTLRRSTNGTQWSLEKYAYTYNGNLLGMVSSLKLNGELIYFLVVENDGQGLPIKVEQRSPDSTLLAIEVGIPDYDHNKIIYQLKDAGGRIISTTEGRIVVKKTGKEKYNLHGDCFFYPRNDSPDDHIFYNVEFDYDSNGNWVRKKIYEGEIDSTNNLINPEMAMEYKRKIKYIKQD